MKLHIAPYNTTNFWIHCKVHSLN